MVPLSQDPTWQRAKMEELCAGLELAGAACNTLPTKAAPPNPSVGASTHTHSTLLTLLSSLHVKELTRGWYGWWTKAYKLAPPLLN
jgi:hypothetical protein